MEFVLIFIVLWKKFKEELALPVEVVQRSDVIRGGRVWRRVPILPFLGEAD